MNTQGKVLVTGASGFVGSAVAHKLVEAGFSVRALVREKGPYSNLADLDIEFIEGDLRDRASIDRAVAGVRYVFHVAADYRLWAPDPGEIYATNLEGTRNVTARARARSGSFIPSAGDHCLGPVRSQTSPHRRLKTRHRRYNAARSRPRWSIHGG
jgi:nucleoside-diphosphate-sugar epimerase